MAGDGQNAVAIAGVAGDADGDVGDSSIATPLKFYTAGDGDTEVDDVFLGWM